MAGIAFRNWILNMHHLQDTFCGKVHFTPDAQVNIRSAHYLSTAALVPRILAAGEMVIYYVYWNI